MINLYYIRNNWQTIIRYAITGFLGACVQVFTLYIFVDILHVWYLIATGLALSVAMIFTFTLHKLWTFKEHSFEHLKRQTIIYILGVSASLFTNICLMYLFVEICNIWYLFAQVLALGITAGGSFIFNRNVTFR